MQLGSLRRQLTLLFVMLAVAQAIVTTLLYSRVKQVAALHTELLQIDELRNELHGLRAAALDAETGQRGFVITGREEYLQPYRTAMITLQPRIDRLRRLALGKPVLKPRVDTLSARLISAQSDIAQLVELRRHDGFAAAQQKMLDGTQRQAVALLRTLTQEIDDEEQQLALAHEHSYALARSTLIGLVSFCYCGSLLVIFGLGVFILSRLRTLTRVLAKPLTEAHRGLRAAAKTAVIDTTTLTVLVNDAAASKAEEQATLDVIARMAKELSTIAMEITSSVRVIADGPVAGQQELYAAQIDSIVTLSGRVAQSALSLELTAAEQRRALDGSGPSVTQLEQNVRSNEQTAARMRKIAKELGRLVQALPGLTGAAQTTSASSSALEISPV